VIYGTADKIDEKGPGKIIQSEYHGRCIKLMTVVIKGYFSMTYTYL